MAPLLSTQPQLETIKYREVLPRDISSLRKLNDASFPIKYDDKFYKEIQSRTRRGYKLHTFVATCSRPSGRQNVDIEAGLSQEEYLIGSITFQVTPMTDSDQDPNLKSFVSYSDLNKQACYIMTVAVHNNFRKRGIASNLLKICMELSEQTPDCVATYLHVIYWNKGAMALYKKHQFNELLELTRYYYFDDKYHDAFLYGKLHIKDTPASDVSTKQQNISVAVPRSEQLREMESQPEEVNFLYEEPKRQPSLFKRFVKSFVALFRSSPRSQSKI